jgi:hypothetical protein
LIGYPFPMKLLAFALFALFAFSLAQEVRYDNHALIRLRFDSENFKAFSKHFPSDSVDVWSHDGGYAAKLDMDIMFTPEQISKLAVLSFNKDLSFDKFEVLERNVQNGIDAEKEEMKKYDEELSKKLSLLKTTEEKENLKFSVEEFYKK